MSTEISSPISDSLSPFVIHVYGPMKAKRLLIENLIACLKARGQKQKDLAEWCGHSEAWISDILNEKKKLGLDEFDRVADFFGLATYQLLQPGISPLTERRVGSRRSSRDRRIGHAQRQLGALARFVDAAARAPVVEASHADPSHSSATLPPSAQALIRDFERKLSTLLVQAELRGQNPAPGASVAKSRKGARGPRGRDPEKA